MTGTKRLCPDIFLYAPANKDLPQNFNYSWTYYIYPVELFHRHSLFLTDRLTITGLDDIEDI